MYILLTIYHAQYRYINYTGTPKIQQRLQIYVPLGMTTLLFPVSITKLPKLVTGGHDELLVYPVSGLLHYVAASWYIYNANRKAYILHIDRGKN